MLSMPLYSSFSYSTCYYVLGLIAKTQQGVEILSELNWEGVISPNGAPEGLCVPQNLALFLSVSITCVSVSCIA